MGLDRNDQLRLLVAERGPLLGFIASLARDRDLAEDVFQTLVVITSEKSPDLDTRERFLSWARTAARYEVNNALRKRHRTVALDDNVMDLLESQWAMADRKPATAIADALDRCLGALTDNARRMLRLRFEDGLSGEDLARALGRTVNTVYVGLSRSYRALADCIEARVAESEARDRA
jgi:RNA polymerase sigma-70 factor (ECF subfamily)